MPGRLISGKPPSVSRIALRREGDGVAAAGCGLGLGGGAANLSPLFGELLARSLRTVCQPPAPWKPG